MLDYVLIQVGTGFAKVSRCDIDLVAHHTWRPMFGQYAITRIDGRGVLMHRLILGAACDGLQVDHRNMDRLDNRRENIRACTRSQNQWNRPSQRAAVFKGAHFCNGRWIARIGYRGKQLYIGTYPTPEAAGRAYDAKAIELHGEFARLNFPKAA